MIDEHQWQMVGFERRPCSLILREMRSEPDFYILLYVFDRFKNTPL